MVFSENFDSYPNWTFGTLADTTTFQLGNWTYGKNRSYPYPSFKPYHYVNISNGIIYGIGSGYSHDSDPNWPDASIDIPISVDGQGGFEVEFRAQCLSSWPNAVVVHLFSDYNPMADTNNAAKVRGWGFNIYGESSNYNIDLIKYPTPPFTWPIYRKYVGPGLMENWHTYKFNRNPQGNWSLFIDGTLRTDWTPPQDSSYGTFNRLLITSMKDGGKLDWVKVYSIKQSSGFAVTAVSPTRNALNVARNASIQVTFDRAVDTATINSSTLKVVGSLSGVHQFTKMYSSPTNTLTLGIDTLLACGENVRVTATRGVRNRNGDSLSQSVAWNFTVIAPSGGTKFVNASVVTTGPSPMGLVGGDFNRDGKFELVTVTSSSNKLYVMQYTTAAGLLIVDSVANNASGMWIATGNFNDDGYLDLVTVNTDNSVRIYTNNGSGKFAAVSSLALGFSISQGSMQPITVGDLDNDGLDDIVIAGNSNRVTVLQNRRNLNFVQQTLNTTLGNAASSVSLVDLDNNNFLDIIANSYWASQASFLRNEGNFVFSEAAKTSVISYPKIISSNDLDGDGLLDLVIGTGNVSAGVMKNNGNFSFTNSQLPFSDAWNYQQAIFDRNADGKLDITSVGNLGGGNIVSFVNNGSMSFTLTDTLKLDSEADWLVAADFNNDGAIDLALASAQTNAPRVRILLNIKQSPGFAVTAVSPSRNAINLTKGLNIEATFSQSVNTATINLSNIAVQGSLTGKRNGSFTFSNGDKTVSFDPAFDFKPGEVVSFTLRGAIKSSSGDSLGTSLVSMFTIAAPLGNGILIQTDTLVTSQPGGVALGDFDKDGDIDLAVTNNGANFSPSNISIFKNDGNAKFQQTGTAGVGAQPFPTLTGDFDGDGDVDLAIVNHHSYTVSILMNNGSGSYTKTQDLSTPVDPAAINGGDLDGDGDIDLVLPCGAVFPSQSPLLVFRNNGSGIFSEISRQTYGVYTKQPLIGDLDGDGDLDLVLFHQESNYISILLNNGNASFSSLPSVPNPRGASSQVVGDIDGNGTLDAVCANPDSALLIVFKNSGNATFTQYARIPATARPISISMNDIDGDGDLDIVAANQNTVQVWLNSGSGNYSPGITAKVGEGKSYFAVASADLDGDGDIDVAVSNFQSNTVSILLNGGTPSRPEQLHLASIRDVPNDQGKQVSIVWKGFESDTVKPFVVSRYSVWRRDSSVWTHVWELPSRKETFYSVVVPTLFDSTKVNGMSWSRFQVTAHANDPLQIAYSQIDSGYSLDNLAPEIPNASGTPSGSLFVMKWKATVDKDFRYFAIYRGTKDGFIPDPKSPYKLLTDTTFAVRRATKDTVYYYRVSAFDFSGNESGYSPQMMAQPVLAVGTSEVLPTHFALEENYPNPFNPSTIIEYQLPHKTNVEISIYNSFGQIVRELLNDVKDVGRYSIIWDGRDKNGAAVASGVYFYQIKAGEFVQAKRMILLK